ncbi:MAG TPA: hypothetical protein VGP64_08680 [Polyangia bacterium]|jgi:hypothetical protein
MSTCANNGNGLNVTCCYPLGTLPGTGTMPTGGATGAGGVGPGPTGAGGTPTAATCSGPVKAGPAELRRWRLAAATP